MQRAVRLSYGEVEAVVEPLAVCTVDVCTLVKQPVERLAVMGEVSETNQSIRYKEEVVVEIN